MFAPATFVTALIMTILSTICWGSFANTYKLTKNYRFELYYWDYAGGIVLISLALAFTLGSSSGGEQSFLANLHSAAPMNMLDAGVGGFLFNIANVLLIAGIEMVGLAIALDRKSTRLNSSHRCISYAVFCLKKNKRTIDEVLSDCDAVLV